MYGVESAVHPAYRGMGVGSRLMDARFDVLRQLNLRGMVAGSAIIDYHTAQHLSPEQYVRQVIGGQRFDTNLSKQLHKGFRVHNIIPNYITDDETLGYGVAIVWENAAHQPTGVPARLVKSRQYPIYPRARR
ncbi:MAG: GNAT family N-acetyltransferase [Chloroflexota bacterium]